MTDNQAALKLRELAQNYYNLQSVKETQLGMLDNAECLVRDAKERLRDVEALYENTTNQVYATSASIANAKRELSTCLQDHLDEYTLLLATLNITEDTDDD